MVVFFLLMTLTVGFGGAVFLVSALMNDVLADLYCALAFLGSSGLFALCAVVASGVFG